VLGSKTLIDYLINFSRSFIYTTALSSSQVRDIEEKVVHLDVTERQVKLQENISFFRSSAQHLPILSEEKSPIQSIHIPTNAAAKAQEMKLNQAGLNVKAILSPTVPKGQECIRISLHSFNTQSEIKQLIQLF
jgi:8-amino-7-oxononanoate synthase